VQGGNNGVQMLKGLSLSFQIDACFIMRDDEITMLFDYILGKIVKY
jgi:hypothetical protein